MRILSVYLKGFKSYERSLEINFSEVENTLISGKNGIGKSSIGDAITWCLYGCNIYGNDEDTKLMNNNSKEMQVRATVKCDNNTTYTITRSRKKTTSILIEYFNGDTIVSKKATQKDLLGIIPNKELFLSVFNPTYFLNKTSSSARTQLLNMLPKVEIEDVLNSYNALDNLTIISSYKDINLGIKQLRKQISDINLEITKKIGEEDTLKKLIDESKNQLSTMTIYDEEDNSEDIKELRTLQKQLFNLENTKVEVVDCSDLKIKLNNINNNINSLNEKINHYSSNYAETITKLNSTISQLKGKSSVLLAQKTKILSLDSVCRECGQAISNDLKVSQEEKISQEINSINIEIEGLLNSINLLQECDINDKRTYINTIENEINSFKVEKSEIENNISSIESLNKAQINNVKANNEENINLLKNKINEIEIKINNTKNLIAQKNQLKNSIENYTLKLQQTLGIIKNKEDDVKLLNNDIQILVEYSSKYVDYITNILKTWLNKVTIELYKVNKTTGEIKDTFNVFYDGRIYSTLSYSEKLKVGIEISNMLNKTLNISLPTLIDNSESIIDVPLIDTQMLTIRVVNSDLNIQNGKSPDLVNKVKRKKELNIIPDININSCLYGKQNNFFDAI